MRPITILFIEDDRLVLNVVKEMLELEGWKVETYEDGAAAMRKIESEERYDLILTDNDLPGMSGLELIGRARELTNHRNTPIIMLSASLYTTIARRAGANVFLRKPEDLSALTGTVKRLLGINTTERLCKGD